MAARQSPSNVAIVLWSQALELLPTLGLPSNTQALQALPLLVRADLALHPKPSPEVAKCLKDAGEFVVKNANGLHWVVEALVEADEIATALRIGLGTDDPEDQVETVCTVARKQRKKGEMESVVKTIRLLKDAERCDEAADSVISEVVPLATPQDIARERQLAALLPLRHQSRLLFEITDAQVNSDDLNGARRTAEAISDPTRRGWAQDSITQALARRGDISGVEKNIKNIVNKDIGIAYLTDAHIKAGKLYEARRLALGITNPQIKENAVSSVLDGLARAGDLTSARQLLEFLPETQPRSENHQKSQGLSHIALAQARAHALTEARKTADSIPYVSVRSKILFQIAALQRDAGDRAGAQQTAEAISHPSWRASALVDLAKAHTALHYDPKPLLALAHAAVVTISAENEAASRVKQNIRYPSAPISTDSTDQGLADLAVAEATLGELDRAKQTSEEIKDYRIQFIALQKIAQVQEDTQDRAGSHLTLASAMGLLKRFPTSGYQVRLLLLPVVERQAQRGDFDGLRITLSGVPTLVDRLALLCYGVLAARNVAKKEKQ